MASTQALDKGLVQKYYSEGEFDPAINLLEDFQKTHSRFTREESLMVYKYLGVIYSANQSTREKGKTYFYKLLKIDPEAKILDMYVSIVVQEIFKGTLEELMGQIGPEVSAETSARPSEKPATARSLQKRQTSASSKKETKLERQSHANYWLLGGLGLVAVAAGGYYLVASSEPDPTEKIIDITPQ